MKKLHLAFGIVALGVLLAGVIHGGVAWIVAEITWDPFANSFPTWAAFVLPILCYSLGASAVLLTWLLTWLTVRWASNKGLQKDNRSDIL